ncbi:MAG: trypsin-like serine protease [Synechococcaceae cyanobacterium SM2_3_1]|nr:trypsin-like serine protease [Synechococcaceae cyanobacterium SM2_3_1]
MTLTFRLLLTSGSLVLGSGLLLQACGSSSGGSGGTVPPVSLGTVEGVHFDDRNGNGFQDPDELGLPGATVFVDSNFNRQRDSGEPSTTTDGEGIYQLSTPPGFTSIALDLPPGRIQTSSGTRDQVSLVIGGTPVAEGDWPWVVGIVRANNPDNYLAQFCAGTLIASNWVLTAAHCLFGSGNQPSSSTEINVLVGTQDLDVGGQRIGVAEIRIHPNYLPAAGTLGGSDIALVRLSEPVFIPGVPLIGPGDEVLISAGTLATVLGWGAIFPGGPDRDPFGFPSLLQQATVPIVSNATCNSPSAYAGDVTDTMLCAGFDLGNIDACSGDSGGPLLVWDGQQWRQTGIVSWGEASCNEPLAYGVYSRIPVLVDFVSDTIDGAAVGFTTELVAGQIQSGVNFGSRFLFTP